MSQAPFQLAGNAAEIYQRYLVPAVHAPWSPVLLAQAALQPGERVLDVACGTGVATRLAAQHVGATGRVVGLDLNPSMLAVARALPVLPGAAIEWREGSVSALPFAEATFDVALCQQGVQFFPDRALALREMHRVLVAGGRLALAVWRSLPDSSALAVFADLLGRHVSAEAAAIVRAPFVLGEAEDLRALVTKAG